MSLRISTVVFGSAFAGLALLMLLDAAVKGFAIFAVAILATLALRRTSAATRHIIWAFALVCALALPICAVCLPQWRVLPAWMNWEEVPERLSVVVPLADGSQAEAKDPIVPVLLPLGDIEANFSDLSGTSATPLSRVLSLIPRTRATAHAFLFVWLGGSILLLGPLFYSLVSLRRIAARARIVADGPLFMAMHELQREIGLPCRIRLLLGHADAMPMVWGTFRPRLLLPSAAEDWEPARLRGVLLHELAHLRRRDPLWMLIAQLALAVHWFNPLAWIAVRQLRTEQERACDDYVLRHGVRASDYASDLLAVATGLRGIPFATAALTMAHPARLEGRIIGILDAARSRRELTHWFAIMAAVIAATIALPLAMLRAAEEKNEAPQNDSSSLAGPASASDQPPQHPEKDSEIRGRLLDRNGFVLAESAEHSTRRYPLGALAAHVLGYTGYEHDGVVSDVLTGRTGAEKIFDEQLRKGKDVRLSLDARLQTVVEKTLRDSGIGRGAVVVTDPATGELLASASFPTFDGSRFTPKVSVEYWKEVSDDPAAPLMNRAITDYIPGSTFKLVVALAACRAGKADKVYECNGSVKYGNDTLRCWREQGHGRLNLRQAITLSCNCYFYQLGNEIGIDAIEETALQLGLGTPPGLGLPGESRGLVASPTSLKKINPVVRWTPGHTANSAVGQSFTQVSPMQMAGVVGAIANGGRVLAPRLQAGEPQELRQDLAVNGYKPEHFHLLQIAMRDAVHANKGTARRADSNLIPIAGKTGSSRVYRLYGERKVDEIDGWFVGYAPADNPRYAFTVVVEGGSTGGTTAAPIARRIMEAVVAELPAPEAQPAGKGHLNPIEDVRFDRN